MEEAEALLLLNSGSTDEDIESVYSKLAINNNYDAFWERLFYYADCYLQNYYDPDKQFGVQYTIPILLI